MHLARAADLPFLRRLRKKLMRIARTNGGYGSWRDETMPVEPAAEQAVRVRRGKTPEELMLPRDEMVFLQVPHCAPSPRVLFCWAQVVEADATDRVHPSICRRSFCARAS
jgi:hypothetical protein